MKPVYHCDAGHEAQIVGYNLIHPGVGTAKVHIYCDICEQSFHRRQKVANEMVLKEQPSRIT